MLTEEEQQIVYPYRDLFDKRKVWRKLTWRGYDVAKIPNDLWLYQEVLFDLKPSLVVEFGTNMGGSALFFADMLDRNGFGRVLTIDHKANADVPQHPRIEYFVGDTRSHQTVSAVRDAIAQAVGPVLFVEDSDHSPENVAGELALYADLVTPGSYFVVEDGGWPDQGHGIRDVIMQFVDNNPEFEIDESKGKFLMTLAPDGWIRRIP